MKYYIVDAFAEQVFTGNQAGVCLVEKALAPDIMQNIAAENNLAETAFIVRRGDTYDLRWFTPEIEIDLCGHATLASAFVVFNFVDRQADSVRFHTQSGPLTVVKKDDLLEMDFPSRPPQPMAITPLMSEAIGAKVLEAHISRDLVLLVESEDVVRSLSPNMELIKTVPDVLGVVVTAPGRTCDFVSRFFAPSVDSQAPEDPVTGSTHCNLIPFWSARLGKNELVARQLSKRGGTLFCRDCGQRVKIAGRAALYLSGEINL